MRNTWELSVTETEPSLISVGSGNREIILFSIAPDWDLAEFAHSGLLACVYRYITVECMSNYLHGFLNRRKIVWLYCHECIPIAIDIILLILANLTQVSGQFKNNLFYYLIIHIIEENEVIMLTSVFKPTLSFCWCLQRINLRNYS